jgi:hypothetical protein
MPRFPDETTGCCRSEVLRCACLGEAPRESLIEALLDRLAEPDRPDGARATPDRLGGADGR